MKRILLLGVVLAGFSHSLWAEESILPAKWHFGAGAGATFPDVDNAHVFTAPGWPEDDYRIADANATAIFSAFGGYTWEREESLWFPFYSLDINYSYALSPDVDGKIRQYSVPEFENYDFEYKLRSQILLGTFKVDIYRYKNIMPFLSAGLGLAWNTVKNYEEHAFEGITRRLSPEFPNKTNIEFAYQFAGGLDFILTERLWASVEYNWADLGRAKTGKSDVYEGQDLNSRLTTNNVLLSFTYYLGRNLED